MKMTETEIKNWARTVAVPLLFIQRGGMDAPETWADVAARRGHFWELFHDPAQGPGEFVSCEPGTGCIRINTAYTPEVMARAFVHEIAHAELNGVLEPVCSLFNTRMGYDDDPGDLRHRIARRVEEICFWRT